MGPLVHPGRNLGLRPLRLLYLGLHLAPLLGRSRLGALKPVTRFWLPRTMLEIGSRPLVKLDRHVSPLKVLVEEKAAAASVGLPLA